MTIRLDATPADARTIRSIAVRARAELPGLDFLETAMDITATHLNGCPLKLQELLAADSFNFHHDVAGIRHHLNRETGELEDFFRPRFAAKQGEAA